MWRRRGGKEEGRKETRENRKGEEEKGQDERRGGEDRREGALLTQGLQVDVDKVEAVVLQAVVGLGWDVQVAVALLVAQVHLDP